MLCSAIWPLLPRLCFLLPVLQGHFGMELVAQNQMSRNETKPVMGQSLEQPALTLVLTWKPPWWLSSSRLGTGMLSDHFLEKLLEQA